MKNSYNRYEFLWHAYDMNLHHMVLVYVNSYDIMKSYIKWCWCLFPVTEIPRQVVSHHFTLTLQKWLYHQPIHTTVKETDWLGYWLTPRGSIPWEKKINAILHMDRPCNATELCMFIGYVNYYCTCHRVVHISLNRIDLRFDNLLHGQTKCRKHLYNAFAYDCKNVACPDHNKWFSIHTNASDFQLGTCIIQEGRLVAYFSCNLMLS